MGHKLSQYLVLCLLLLCSWPTHANTPAGKFTEFFLKNMNMEEYVAMLKEHYGGKQSQLMGAFSVYEEEIRAALLTNPLIRKDTWNFLGPILKTLPAAPTQLTFDKFEKVFLNLAGSSANFGPMASKLLAPEEMIGHIDSGDFGGLYLGTEVAAGQLPSSMLGTTLYVFPGHFTGASMLFEDGRRSLAAGVYHEFLHHVSHVLHSMRLLPEDFMEQQNVLLGDYLEASNSQNTYEHLWVYTASEHMDAYLPLGFLKKVAMAGTFPTMVALRWLPRGEGGRL